MDNFLNCKPENVYSWYEGKVCYTGYNYNYSACCKYGWVVFDYCIISLLGLFLLIAICAAVRRCMLKQKL